MKEYLIRPGHVYYFKTSPRVPPNMRGKAFLAYKMGQPDFKHNKVFYDKNGNPARPCQLTDTPCIWKECPCH